MRHELTSLRPGMTAIVAAVAMTSTPLLAQDVAPAAEAAPVTVAPAPATLPDAPAAAAAASAPSSAAPVTGNQLFPQIRVNMDDAAVAEEAAAPAAASPVAAQRASVARTERRATPVTPTVAPAAAPTTLPPAAATVASPPAAPPVPAERVASPAAPDAVQPSPATLSGNDYAVAGAAGLGVLALLGGSFLLLRRRRRDGAWTDEEDTLVAAEADRTATLAAESFVAAPVMASAPAMAAAPLAGTPAPAGVEGRHVKAAYAGPSAENPSLSLKKRLKRARALDMMERRMAEQGLAPRDATPTPTPAAAPKAAPQPSMTQWGYTQPASAAGNRPRQSGFRPAYQ